MSLQQRFLTGETLCCFDTELMPKLQHIRVAGKFFVGFEIPESMTHLWSYIREMYQLDAFTQSCPADQVHMHLKFVCLTMAILDIFCPKIKVSMLTLAATILFLF